MCGKGRGVGGWFERAASSRMKAHPRAAMVDSSMVFDLDHHDQKHLLRALVAFCCSTTKLHIGMAGNPTKPSSNHHRSPNASLSYENEQMKAVLCHS